MTVDGGDGVRRGPEGSAAPCSLGRSYRSRTRCEQRQRLSVTEEGKPLKEAEVWRARINGICPRFLTFFVDILGEVKIK